MADVPHTAEDLIAPAEVEEVELYHAHSWITKYVFCQDAKVIAKDNAATRRQSRKKSEKAEAVRQQPKIATPEKPKPKQITFMRVKSEVTDVDTAPLAESVFAIPAGYTERESMFPVLPAR